MPKTMRFPSNNTFRFHQDTAAYRGLPCGVDFQVERVGGMFRLRGDGYGARPPEGEYGNGALYVWDLTERQRRRFEEACDG